MATIKLAGKPVNTNAELPAIGQIAPGFELVTSGLKNASLGQYKGKRKLLYIVSSLDTDICALTTRKLNEMAGQNSEAVFMVITSDLPFAIQRFCKTKSLKKMISLSMMRSRKFARDYGVLLIDGPLAGLTARALLVLDKDNTVLYSELVEDITHEPNYEAAIDVLQS
jgi:thiol peroxidase